MSVICKLHTQGLDVDALHSLQFSMLSLLDENGIDAATSERPPSPGAKGAEIGDIVLAVFTSGTAVALMHVLRAAFDRQSSLIVTLQDGQRKLQVNAKDVDRDTFDATCERASALFAGIRESREA